MLTGSKTPLIWPLLDKLNPRTAYQQRPRSANPLGVARLPSTPWDESDRPRGLSFGRLEGTPTLWELALWNIGLAKLGLQPTRLRNFLTNPRPRPYSEQRRVPAVIHSLKPLPPTYFKITGTTKDSTGAALGTCIVDWFDTATDVKISTTTSDANGLYEFRTAGQPPNAYYLVAYKAGSPDVAGTTVNTLTGI